MQKTYDLELRTAIFGENVITLCRKFKRDPVSLPLITQVVRSATSIGANYMEANGGNSKKEFGYRITLCKREANETKYWLRMLSPFCDDKQNIEALRKEAQELMLIFQKITKSMQEKKE